MELTIDAADIPAVIERLEQQAAEPAPDYVVQDGLYLRPEMDLTLADLLEDWRGRTHWASAPIHSFETTLLEEEQKIVFGKHEVPATERGLEALARFLGMPVRYLLKVPADEQQFMFDKRIERAADEFVSVEYTSNGIDSIRKRGKAVVDPVEIVDKVTEWLPLESPVRDAWVDHNDLRLDVLFSDLDESGHARLHGDDLLVGGVRITQNRKQNLAPVVRPILYFASQTNTLEIDDPTLRVDARGKDEVEIVTEIGYKVKEAIDRLGRDLASYSGLASEKVGNDPSGALRRIAMDAGLSERTTSALLNRVTVASDEPTMFGFANLIANQANYLPRSKAAQVLQQAAGALVNDHTQRCKACHHRLV